MANETSSSLTFSGALFLVFLVLKLTNQIAWSWWWVTAPLWAAPLVVLGTFLVGAVVVVFFTVVRSMGARWFR